jgi:hypothetical protein
MWDCASGSWAIEAGDQGSCSWLYECACNLLIEIRRTLLDVDMSITAVRSLTSSSCDPSPKRSILPVKERCPFVILNLAREIRVPLLKDRERYRRFGPIISWLPRTYNAPIFGLRVDLRELDVASERMEVIE